MKKIKIAMGQVLVEGGEPNRNLERAEKMVVRAAKRNVDLIVLPETIDFAWTHPSLLNEAKAIPGYFSDFFERLAKKHKVYICVGLTEKDKGGFFNSVLLINKSGKTILKHRKINLLDVEQPYYQVGGKLEVVETELGKIGVNICADNYKNSIHIGKTLGHMGADIILSPSAWTVGHNVTEADDPYKDKWETPLKYIASMFEIPVIAVTSVGYIVGGPYEGKKQIGCSLAVNQNGIIKKGEFNEFAGSLSFIDVLIKTEKKKGTELLKKIEEKGFKPELKLCKKKKKIKK